MAHSEMTSAHAWSNAIGIELFLTWSLVQFLATYTNHSQRGRTEAWQRFADVGLGVLLGGVTLLRISQESALLRDPLLLGVYAVFLLVAGGLPLVVPLLKMTLRYLHSTVYGFLEARVDFDRSRSTC
jgi:hypothetical protein